MTTDLLTTRQAAEHLHVGPHWVRVLITRGDLPATRHGRDWVIQAQDLDRVRVRRGLGRPRRTAQSEAEQRS